MELINQFALLDMDSDSSNDRHTPNYPPVSGTTPTEEKIQHAEMVAKIWEIDEEMKNTRFREWNINNAQNGFSTSTGRKSQHQESTHKEQTHQEQAQEHQEHKEHQEHQEHQEQSQQTQPQQTQTPNPTNTDTHSFPSVFGNRATRSMPPSLSLTPVRFERHNSYNSYKPNNTYNSYNITKPKILNTNSNTEFPSLGGALKGATPGVWRSGKSFVTTVSQMAERQQAAEDQRMRDNASEERRHRLDMASLPIANRFRRRLEDILVEERDEESTRYDDNAFPDDNYVPTIDDMEAGYDGTV